MVMAEEQKKGLEGVVIADTRLSKVYGDIGKLIYCGYDIRDLAEHASFEEVIFLLWYGSLPTKTQLERLQHRLHEEMTLHPSVLQTMKLYPPNAHPMAVLRTAVPTLASTTPPPKITARTRTIARPCA